MTRRERVLRTIRHQEPDRVPVDLGAMRSTGITAVAYGRLKEHLGIDSGHVYVYDVIQQLALPEETVLNYVESDVVDLGRVFLRDKQDWSDFTLPNGAAAKIPAYVRFIPREGGWLALGADDTTIGAMPQGAYYLSQTRFPLEGWDGADLTVLDRLPELMEKVTWSALPCAPYHKPLTPEHLADIRRRAKYLYETTDYAVMIAFGANLLEWGQYLCRMDQFLIDLVENRRKAEALLDKLVEMHIGNLEKILDAVSGYVQIIQMGDDLGTQLALEISPRLYREVFKPRQKLIFETVKKRSGPHLFLHSCGAIADILPDLIEVGVEIINPVQTSARGMDPARLKREFGQDIVFWGGGCDTQKVLPLGTPDEIDAHVKERIETFAPGGGFVFTQIHNIMPNVPPRNIVGMFDAVKKYR
ncbi:MAG: uroporphyrinogen decarboxylase family protein [Candidatus Aminicenantes bacterium]|nr:uroporphyrinogen decarboxylase family protein [Candidatus Aminicenantes bacterium]